MTKNDIVQKTLRDLGLTALRPHPPYSDEPELEAYLMDRLPDGEDIKTCEDFQHLGATCCEVCHYSYPHSDMYLIDLPQGGKAWVCDQVRWALFPEEKGKLRPWDWQTKSV
jgi:hypothetical protein